MVALLLVAVSVGLSNFAAAIGIGTGGVDSRTRLRVGLIFGLYEAGMPVAGLLAGQQLASARQRDRRGPAVLLIDLDLYRQVLVRAGATEAIAAALLALASTTW